MKISEGVGITETNSNMMTQNFSNSIYDTRVK